MRRSGRDPDLDQSTSTNMTEAWQMSIKLNQSERLAAMNLDAEALVILRELRPLVAQHIDAAVTAAYAQFMRCLLYTSAERRK